MKEAFFPVTQATTRGYFDIITRRSGDVGGSSDKVSRALELLNIGDELAFKAGKYRLNYQGEDDPIKFVTMLVSGLGITPALQMLRGVLPGKDTTVREAEVLWINEEKADFVCNKEVESLEYRYIEKLFVSRVIQADLFGMDIGKNEKVLESLSPYEEGRIAVVCGPDYVVSRARNIFLDLGYPSENILSVVIP